MANQFRVDMVAVEEKVWSGDVEFVQARTTEGELGILANHEPLLGQLAEPGEVRLKIDDDHELNYSVDGGFISVTKEGVTILAESCTPATPDSSH